MQLVHLHRLFLLVNNLKSKKNAQFRQRRKIRFQSSSPSTSSWSSTPNPERLAFSSKLEKFEREIEIKRPDANPTTKSTLPPG
ncbi:unnamed protein product [Brugia timori]|uniref:Ovule protein n=1 Tax=Brugia timori TaxID=42155 RepID=A0A0R3QRC6_9BILA|nr:unnamed protein product [Brugia timori]